MAGGGLEDQVRVDPVFGVPQGGEPAAQDRCDAVGEDQVASPVAEPVGTGVDDDGPPLATDDPRLDRAEISVVVRGPEVRYELVAVLLPLLGALSGRISRAVRMAPDHSTTRMIVTSPSSRVSRRVSRPVMESSVRRFRVR